MTADGLQTKPSTEPSTWLTRHPGMETQGLLFETRQDKPAQASAAARLHNQRPERGSRPEQRALAQPVQHARQRQQAAHRGQAADAAPAVRPGVDLRPGIKTSRGLLDLGYRGSQSTVATQVAVAAFDLVCLAYQTLGQVSAFRCARPPDTTATCPGATHSIFF